MKGATGTGGSEKGARVESGGGKGATLNLK